MGGMRKVRAEIAARNKRHDKKKPPDPPRCCICGFMPAKRGRGNLFWCKAHNR